MDSNIVDLTYETPGVNMYGCQPCPKCESRYRYQTQDRTIHCDDCGYDEMGVDHVKEEL